MSERDLCCQMFVFVVCCDLERVHSFPTRRSSDLADMRQGDVQRLISQPLSMLVLADVGHLATPERRALEAWIEDGGVLVDRKSTRLNSSHVKRSYAVFCLKKKIGSIREG